ncbi:uncharacterized protein OCT59_002078 [Rhizophagus irregularis]|uniref:uncharacterized protein n=1 Tax=Rhizophagus irregularis TaxID=588596 RepID=UPI0033250CEF|nr:hypothetical protein OCT59_002078 [Rhizophagus irregularis]
MNQNGEGDQGAPHYPEVTNASFTSGELTITIQTWEGRTPVQALGHYTFHADSGVEWRFLKNPQFVQGHHCEIDVYTNCYHREFGSSEVGCLSFDIHYRGWQPPL